LIKNEDWEFLDFISFDHKINCLKKFATGRLSELQGAFAKDEKSDGYFDRVLVKVLDNLQVNIKNIHIRIEEPKAPSYSLGITLEEIFIVNTDDKWEQKFIDRNKNKNIDIFKQLKILNFGLYLRTNETYFISQCEDVKSEMDNLFPLNCPYAKNIDYLIRPSKY
jgi:vacuolar protein sorting-associated protein 13A/C